MTTSQAHSGPERLLRIASWIVALVFAVLLNMLGELVIRDMFFAPQSGPPAAEQFADQQAQAPLLVSKQDLERQQHILNDKQETLGTTLDRARKDYAESSQSFRNWIDTRKATGNSSQDPEVLARTRQLDELQGNVRNWQRQQDAVNDQMQALQLKLNTVEGQLSQLQNETDQRYERANQQYQLKVFALRLAFTLPILLLAIWLFIRFRKHRYWPFVYGFGLFALFAFFVELVPYLPSFGGYIRVVVGIVLTVFAGIYMLKVFQRYVERKRLEMQQSQTERARTVVYEKAISSYQKKLCPSCDKPWNLGGDGANFCIHCGLELFRICSCGGRNFAFFPFCHKCGEAVQKGEDTTPAEAVPALLQANRD